MLGQFWAIFDLRLVSKFFLVITSGTKMSGNPRSQRIPKCPRMGSDMSDLKKRVPNARKLPIYKNKNLFFGVAENFWLAKILLYEKKTRILFAAVF